jgi:hypothetical protein
MGTRGGPPRRPGRAGGAHRPWDQALGIREWGEAATAGGHFL